MTGRQQLSVVAVVAVLALIAAVVLRTTLHDELHPLGVGTSAPEFHAVTLGAPPARRTLDSYRGQVVLLNIWATWCAPCRAEMPSLERVYQQLGPHGLKVAAVSIDDPGSEAAIRQFADELGLTFDVLYDPSGDIQRTYMTTGVPETVVIGRDGVIRKKVAMATDWDSDANRRMLARLLRE